LRAFGERLSKPIFAEFGRQKKPEDITEAWEAEAGCEYA
jgi:hypothetical protein